MTTKHQTPSIVQILISSLLSSLYSLLLSNHPITLDVDHDVLDVGVAGPAVLLHDAHLAGPEAVGVGGDGVRVDLDVAVTVGAPQAELLGLTVSVLAQPAHAQLWGGNISLYQPFKVWGGGGLI